MPAFAPVERPFGDGFGAGGVAVGPCDFVDVDLEAKVVELFKVVKLAKLVDFGRREKPGLKESVVFVVVSLRATICNRL